MSDVFPASPRECMAHGALADRKLNREFFMRNTAVSINCPKLAHLYLCQLGVRLSATTKCFMATFRHHVLRVVPSGSNKQVRGATTWRIIALVKDAFSFRNWAAFQFPDYARCKTCPVVDAEISVTHRRTAGRPNPALPKFWAMLRNWAIFVDLSPEPLRKRLPLFLPKTLRQFAVKRLRAPFGFHVFNDAISVSQIQ